MKKHIAAILIFICVFSLGGCKDKEQALEDIPMMGNHVVFNYDELTEHAKIIAKVEMTDELTAENSFSLNDPETGSMGGFYGKRTCKVLEYYKDTTGQYSEELSFIEAAAIMEDKYFHIDEYETLKKGNEYILFLSDDTASGDMSIMSCNNGVVRLSPDEEDMNYPEIAERAGAELL